MKYVSETKAGKQISAWVVMKGKKDIAHVHAHYSDGGMVTVNIFQDYGDTQYGRAGGYGYDKLTAALSGLSIAGITLTNHCQKIAKPPTPKGWPEGAKCPKGYHFANWKDGYYWHCYRDAGLKVLEAYGLKVISVI